MAPRVMAVSSYRMLEWGQESSQPGSRVRDARDAPVFTGSRVVDARYPDCGGVVVELVDVGRVRVAWDARPGEVTLAPSALIAAPLPG